MKVLNRDSLSIVKIFASILIVGCMLNRADVSSAQAPFRVNNDTKSDMETYLERKRAQQEARAPSIASDVKKLGTTGERWKYFRGATEAEQRKEEGTDSVTAAATFFSCQDLIRPHSFGQIAAKPIKIRETCGEYDIYPGVQSGVCIHCDLGPPWCDYVYCHTASLIEYYFPAYKLDQSEQVLATPYITKEVGEGYADVLRKIEKVLPEQISESVRLAATKAQQAVNVKDRDIASKMKAPDAGKLKELIRKNFEDINSFRDKNPKLMFLNAQGTKAYSRNITENLNSMSATGLIGYLEGTPHIPINHFFGTDFPQGYAFSKFLKYSTLFFFRWYQFLTPQGERRCILNNIASGKTRPLRGIANWGMYDLSGSCLNSIGEIYPLTADRRLELTDAAYQAAVRGMRIFTALYPEGLRHSYLESTDKWSIVRPKAFRAESVSCAPLEKLTMNRTNMTFNKANATEEKTSERSTFTIWPDFKGCWNYKGVGQSYWSPEGGGQIIEYIPSHLPYGQLRIR